MRRLPRISVRLSAAVAGAALCVAVAVLAATGAFNGVTKHVGVVRPRAAAAAPIIRRCRTSDEAIRGNVSRERYCAVGIAEKYLGVPYVWGGAKPSGFDASGLVMYAYARLGVSLPHYTVSQYNYPNAVHPSRSQLQPGDLVFFAGLAHVGIYIGDNLFIHAPHTGTVVSIDSISGWYSHEYDGATRIRRKT